jgi:hypothetical protein
MLSSGGTTAPLAQSSSADFIFRARCSFQPQGRFGSVGAIAAPEANQISSEGRASWTVKLMQPAP